MTLETRFSHFASILGVALVLSVGLVAQTVPARPGTATHPATPKQEPCWQVAGISKSAMEQRRSIMENAHSQVEAVCANTSLTPQQRNEKIHQIHEQAKQQADALVSTSQMQSLKSCQESRAGSHPSMAGGHHGGGAGPCGTLPGTSGGSPGTSGGKPAPEPEN